MRVVVDINTISAGPIDKETPLSSHRTVFVGQNMAVSCLLAILSSCMISKIDLLCFLVILNEYVYF